MVKVPIILVVGLLFFYCSCGNMAAAEYMKYKDPKQPLNTRVNDLLKRMTTEEKIGQMTQIERSVATNEVMKKYYIGNLIFLVIYNPIEVYLA